MILERIYKNLLHQAHLIEEVAGWVNAHLLNVK